MREREWRKKDGGGLKGLVGIILGQGELLSGDGGGESVYVVRQMIGE